MRNLFALALLGLSSTAFAQSSTTSATATINVTNTLACTATWASGGTTKNFGAQNPDTIPTENLNIHCTTNEPNIEIGIEQTVTRTTGSAWLNDVVTTAPTATRTWTEAEFGTTKGWSDTGPFSGGVIDLPLTMAFDIDAQQQSGTYTFVIDDTITLF